MRCSVARNRWYIIAASLLLSTSVLSAELVPASAGPPFLGDRSVMGEGGLLPSSRDSLNVRVIGRWPFGPASAVTADEARTITYLGAGGGIYILDTSDPRNPAQLAEMSTPGYVRDMILAGDHLYVADNTGGLRIMSVSDPVSPVELGSSDTPDRTRGLVVKDTLVFLAEDAGGVRVISVSDPSDPVEIGMYAPPDSARSVTLEGSHAYVAASGAGLRVVSIADPANPVEVGFLESLFVMDVAVSGSHAYLVDQFSGLRVVSIADPANLSELGSYVPSASAGAVAVSGSYACVTKFSPVAMWVVSVDPPEFPFELGYYDCVSPGSWAWDVDVEDSYAYLTDTQQGLHIVSISETGTPTGSGLFGIDGYATGVDAVGSLACVADNYYGLRVIDTSDPEHPASVRYYQTS